MPNRAQVSVLEMDGQFDKLEELIYVESHLSNTSAKFYGEITQQMLKNSQYPGSTNGTGLFQTIVGLKIREVATGITLRLFCHTPPTSVPPSRPALHVKPPPVPATLQFPCYPSVIYMQLPAASLHEGFRLQQRPS